MEVTMRALIAALLLLPAQGEKTFRAGAAASNITPPLGEPIVGGFSPTPAAHVHDELHARCLALDDGTTRLVFVVCDNVGISREVLDEARALVHKETGLPPEHLLLSATHTHSATSARSGKPLSPEPLADYSKFLVRRIGDGVRRAINNLEHARIGWGFAQAPEHLFNRRYFMKPGTPMPDPFGGDDQVVMNPGVGNPKVDRPAGPTDPEVSFILVRAKAGRPIALLANYSLHYVGGVPGTHISADYFAVFADRIGQRLGTDRQDPPFVGIMTNGTSGDVNNIDVLGSPQRHPPYEKMKIVAHSVADKVLQASEEVKLQDWAPLAARTKDLVLQARRPTPEMVSRAREVLARPKDARPRHVREPNYAQRVLQMAEAPQQVSVPLQAVRIGDLGIAAIPFEVFTDIGLEIKKRTPFPRSFTISLANGSYGYLPTPEHHKLGGYETWLGTNRVEVEASRKITEAVLELLAALK
jgi:hypothetical protein